MKPILTFALIVSLAGRAWADDKDDVAAAAKKTAEAKSYSFKGETKMELPAFGGQGGGAQDPQKFEGKFEDGVGTHILTDSQEIVKIGGKTASRPRAEWRVVDETAQGGGQGGGGRGGFGRMMGGMGRSPKAPHEEFKDFASIIAKATKLDRKELVGEMDCEVYTLELTEDGAKSVIPMGGMMGRMAQNAEFKGEGKVWILDGKIAKFTLKTVVTASVQGNDIEMSAERTTSIFDAEKTKVEIPAEAKKAIDKASD